MNAGEIVIAAVGAAGGVGGAVFAWVQAKAAVDSRDDAQEAKKDAEAAQKRAEDARDEALELSRQATDAALRQAAAQEEANRLEVEARAPRNWTGPRFDGKNAQSWINTSGKDITIHEVEVLPSDTAGLVRLRTPESVPGVVPSGGALRVVSIRLNGPSADVLKVVFNVEGEDVARQVDFPLS